MTRRMGTLARPFLWNRSQAPEPDGQECPSSGQCDSILRVSASEFSRVVVVSARDMKTTGHVVPHSTPPDRQSAVYMIAFTVRLADARSGNSIASAAPTTSPAIFFFSPASVA